MTYKHGVKYAIYMHTASLLEKKRLREVIQALMEIFGEHRVKKFNSRGERVDGSIERIREEEISRLSH